MIMNTEKQNQSRRYLHMKVCLTVLLTFVMITACNDVMEDTLKYDYPESGTKYETGHVLLIVMDGASGKAVQAARNARMTPNLKDMAAHALYTDYGLSDNSARVETMMTNERGWANLMIGNTTHGIQDKESLEAYQGSSLVERLSSTATSVYMYAADKKFRTAFTPDGIEFPEMASDEAVKNHVLEDLKNTVNIPADLTIAQFSGVNEAGMEAGFYDEEGAVTQPIIDAVAVMDVYIGEMWNALKARPNFKQENWLLIVTSNYGGYAGEEDSTQDFYNISDRNIFIMMYNERFMSQVQGKPSNTGLSYNYNTLVWSYDYQNENPRNYVESARLNNTSLGSIKVSKTTVNKKDIYTVEPMTIQFFFKASVASPEKYIILSKSAWLMDNGWYFYFRKVNNRQKLCFAIGYYTRVAETANENIDWSKWHSVLLTIDEYPQDVTKTHISMYIDGVKQPDKTTGKDGQSIISNKDVYDWWYRKKINGNNQSGKEDGDPDKIPVRICGTNTRKSQNSHWDIKKTQSKSNFHVTNIQFYNVAIPEKDVKKYAGMNLLDQMKDRYPYWNNLVGYWPCDRELDAGQLKNGQYVLKNYSDYGTDDDSTWFVVDRGPVTEQVWKTGMEQGGVNPIPESDPLYYRKTVNSVDISSHIYMWLGKSISWNWSSEGRVWTFTYSDMVEDRDK